MNNHKIHAALLGCSDGLSCKTPEAEVLCGYLRNTLHIIPHSHPTMFCKAGRTAAPEERAAALMEAFSDPEINLILDLSGGDAANAVLPHLNFAKIRRHPKPFFGYSDLSVLLNPLAQLAGVPVHYFQPRFLPASKTAQQSFRKALNGETENWNSCCTFIQGDSLSGIPAGGNIRCTLKLIGTPYQPDFTNKVLFLESFSGGLGRMETMLHQYSQIGAFKECRGVLLGNFTELNRNGQLTQLYQMVQEIIGNPNLPVVCTTTVGHQPDSLCLPYHVPLTLEREFCHEV